MYGHSQNEFDRSITSVFYAFCSGPMIASQLVINPKAKVSFIKFCVKYQAINKFVPYSHTTISYLHTCCISENLGTHDEYGYIDAI
jgi:hypothetical protein